MKKSSTLLFFIAGYSGKARKLAGLFVLFMILFAVGRAAAQNGKTVHGVVLDDHNTPLASVSVMTKQARSGTVTDGSGRFELRANSSDSLVFSLVGYKTQALAVDGQSAFRVVLLNNEAQALNDVIVVGYGTQKKSDVTGAIASVPQSRLSQIPVTNAFSAIEGAVAGVNVTTTSSIPGSTPSMLVRGQNSITASTSPYIIVDGMPLIKTAGNTINDINPNDIASIEILKDASATARYGVNGSNGVILITTKRGLTGKPVIRYNGLPVLKIWHMFLRRYPARNMFRNMPIIKWKAARLTQQCLKITGNGLTIGQVKQPIGLTWRRNKA